MARNFVRASGHYINFNPVLTDYTTKLSLGFWIKFTTAPGSGERYMLFCKHKDGNDINFHLEYRNDAGTKRLQLAWSQPVATFSIYHHDVDLATDTWYHLCVTADWTTNPDTIVLYIDGASVALTLTGSNNATPTTGAIQAATLGRHGTLNQNYLNGDMAEFFTLADTLTTEEVTILADGFTPRALNKRYDSYLPLLGRHSTEPDLFGKHEGEPTSTTPSAHPKIMVYPYSLGSYVPAALPVSLLEPSQYVSIHWPRRVSKTQLSAPMQSFTDSSAPPLVLAHDNRSYQSIFWPKRASKRQVKADFQSFIDPAIAGFTAHWKPSSVRIARKKMFQAFIISASAVRSAPISGGGGGPVAPAGEFAQWAPDPLIRIEPKRANIRLRAPMAPKFGAKTRPC
jgi:hypothetical protein